MTQGRALGGDFPAELAVAGVVVNGGGLFGYLVGFSQCPRLSNPVPGCTAGLTVPHRRPGTGSPRLTAMGPASDNFDSRRTLRPGRAVINQASGKCRAAIGETFMRVAMTNRCAWRRQSLQVIPNYPGDVRCRVRLLHESGAGRRICSVHAAAICVEGEVRVALV